jgi:hypothetical protein
VCLPVSIAPIYIYILYCSVIYKITTQPWEQGRVLFLLSLPFLLSAEDRTAGIGTVDTIKRHDRRVQCVGLDRT